MSNQEMMNDFVEENLLLSARVKELEAENHNMRGQIAALTAINESNRGCDKVHPYTGTSKREGEDE